MHPSPELGRNSHLVNRGPGYYHKCQQQPLGAYNSSRAALLRIPAYDILKGLRAVYITRELEATTASETQGTSSNFEALSPSLESSLFFLLPAQVGYARTTFCSGSEAILMQKAAKLGLSKIENAICVFLFFIFLRNFSW